MHEVGQWGSLDQVVLSAVQPGLCLNFMTRGPGPSQTPLNLSDLTVYSFCLKPVLVRCLHKQSVLPGILGTTVNSCHFGNPEFKGSPGLLVSEASISSLLVKFGFQRSEL